MFDFDNLEHEEVRTYAPLVLHEDAVDAAVAAANRSVDQLLWQGRAEVAKAVTLFGPGIVVLPVVGRVAGVERNRVLEYGAHPKRLMKGGFMDRVDLEAKFGRLDPQALLEELSMGKRGAEERCKELTDEELQDEVSGLQDWRAKANARLKTLEKRAAWAFLGMKAGSADQVSLKKAFKRKALELHPDKGGDAERFQLLQEMKDLLIEPTPMDQEADPEGEKDKSDEDETDKKEGEDKDDSDKDDASGSDSDSEQSDEEIKTEFKKKKRKKKEDDAEDPGSLGVGDDFCRAKHEAARKKLHRDFEQVWNRVGKLTEEIRRSSLDESSGDALRQLRKFVDRFVNHEISKLKENDPTKAERIFRRFLEQSSEVLCAAGVADPVATASVVAMQVNHRLLALAPSPELRQRCAALIDAINHLPSTLDEYVVPLERTLAKKMEAARAAQAAAAQAPQIPLQIRLLTPPDNVRDLDMPPGATVADLRRRAMRVLGADVEPRLFFQGRFLPDPAHVLASGFKDGDTVHALPSYKPVGEAGRAAAAAKAKAAELRAAAAAKSQASGAVASGAIHSASPPSTTAAAAKPADRVGAASATNVDSASLPSSAGAATKPTDGLDLDGILGSLGLGGQSAPAATPAREPSAAREESQPAAAAAPAPTTGPVLTAVLVAEDEAVEFPASSQRAAPDPESMRRSASSTSAVLSWLAAAGWAETQSEDEEAAGLGSAPTTPAASAPASPARAPAADTPPYAEGSGLENNDDQEDDEFFEDFFAKKKIVVAKHAEVKSPVVVQVPEKPAVLCRDVVAAAPEPEPQALQRVRQAWDKDFEHPCAGGRRADGSGIYCHPCAMWVCMAEPFDHRSFELHCEKVGHYGWID